MLFLYDWTGWALCCLVRRELAWLFLEPDTGMDNCPRILLSCLRAWTSALPHFLPLNTLSRSRSRCSVIGKAQRRALSASVSQSVCVLHENAVLTVYCRYRILWLPRDLGKIVTIYQLILTKTNNILSKKKTESGIGKVVEIMNFCPQVGSHNVRYLL